jgi:hypothetical protein
MCKTWGHGWTECPCIDDLDEISTCFNVAVGNSELDQCSLEPMVRWKTPGACFVCRENDFYWAEPSRKPKFELGDIFQDKIRNKNKDKPETSRDTPNVISEKILEDTAMEDALDTPENEPKNNPGQNSEIPNKSFKVINEDMDMGDPEDVPANEPDNNLDDSSKAKPKKIFTTRQNVSKAKDAPIPVDGSEKSEDESMDKLINKPLEKLKGTLVRKPERKKSVGAARSPPPPEGVRQSNRVPKPTKRYVA